MGEGTAQQRGRSAGCDARANHRCKDYDDRNALHIAAAEGRLLAVSYLMSNSFSPHFVDRWGATAMDDALKGHTMYHMYCAKLIQSMGGRASLLSGTEDGARALEALDALPIDDVRQRLMYLNRSGYSQIVPKPVVDEGVLSAHERCFAHLPWVQTMTARMTESAEKCDAAAAELGAVATRLEAHILPICRQMDAARLGNPAAARTDSARSLPAVEAPVAEHRVSIFQEGVGSRRVVASKLTKVLRNAMEAGETDLDARLQADLAWDELLAAGETQPLQGVDALDSDEEAELFAEVDALTAELDFCEAHGIERGLYKAHRFQASTLRIGDMEAMYARLCAVFAYCKGGCVDPSVLHAPPPDAEPWVTVEDLVAIFDVLGAGTAFRVPRFEVEAMFEAASAFRPGSSAKFSHSFKTSIAVSEGCADERVSLRRIVAGSEGFRSALLRLPVDEAYGLVMQKSRLCEVVGEPVLRDLCKAGGVRIAGKGEVLFDARRRTSTHIWFVVISGSLSLTQHAPSGDEDADCQFLSNGSVFGGCGHLVDGEVLDCSIRCSSGCQIAELPVQGLLALRELRPDLAEKLAAEMAEVPTGDRATARVVAAIREAADAVGAGSGGQGSLHSLLAPTKWAGETVRFAEVVPESASLSVASTVSHDSSPTESAVTLMDLYVISSGFRCIHDLWHCIAGGEPHISKTVLYSMQSDLGEVGGGIFRKIFAPWLMDDVGVDAIPLESFHDIDASEFWGNWMRLLLDRRSDEYQRRMSLRDCTYESELRRGAAEPDPPVGRQLLGVVFGWAASLLSDDGSRLRKRCFDKAFVRSGRYEEAYAHTMGSLNPALMDDNILVYIANLFPDLAHDISFADCVEFKEIFGKNGNQSTQVSWADIHKVLQPIQIVDEQSTFIGTAFHPQSRFMVLFWHGMELLAAYHFVSVPLLLCFAEDAATMSSLQTMSVFIPADILTALSTLIQINTAYRSAKRNAWETSRLRIARRLSYAGMIPALPLDWVAHALGIGYEACLWIRMSKLLVIFRVVGRGVGLRAQTSMARHVLYQILASLAVLHVCCCFWYFIARKYPLADPQNPYVWYKPNYPEDDPRYRPNVPTHTNSFEYDLLSCNQTQTATCSPQDSWYYFGMSYTDGMMAKYVLSIYLVSTRIANQGLYGNIVPQNFVEVGFCIVFMIFNLTLFRLVIGDLSALVMQTDAGKFEARTRSMKIFSFISKNSFSADLANEIRLYCENASDHASSTRCVRVLRFLPRFLQDEAARHVCRDLLDKMELLAGCSEHLKHLLCSATSIKAFSAEEYLFRIGEVAEDLYIVQAGSVDTVVESAQTLTGEKLEAVVCPGAAVEQVAFFFQLRFVVSARAAREGGAVCLRIGRASFLQILKCFPADEELVSQSALRTVAFNTKSGASIASFHSDKEGEKTIVSGRGSFSDVSAGRHGKKNKHSIEHVESNRKKMKLLMLFSAVKAGNLATVQSCLKGELVSVNDRDDSGRCLLHVAACEGNAEIAEFLLRASADVNLKDHRGNTPLNEAVNGCHDRIAALIREHSPSTLLSLDGSQAGTRLCEAAGAGDLAQVRRLLENGVDVNAHDYDRRTGLHLAACEGRAEVVEMLLGACANASQRDRFGNTALDDAIRHGHASIKRLIYDAGARVSGMSNVLRACAASADGDPMAIELTKNLVENGLDPMAGDYDGRTPLHLAACSGKLGLLEYFISKIRAGGGGESDSLFNVVDRYGYTPLDDADRHGHAAAIVVLEAAGAMRRGDPRLAAAIEARQRRDQEERRTALRGEAAAWLSTSPETRAWAQVRFRPDESRSLARSPARFGALSTRAITRRCSSLGADACTQLTRRRCRWTGLCCPGCMRYWTG